MKILVFNGSPKGNAGNSNTMHITRAFLEGASFDDVGIIDVSKQKIKPCTGCYACWNKTPGKCIFRDSMDEILEKRIAADIIVWSFPLYVFNVPGGLKNLIDRQLPMKMPGMAKDREHGGHPSRYDLAHQRHIIISTCGFWTTEGNYGSTVAMFDRYHGAEKNTYILCSQGGLFGSEKAPKSIVNGYLQAVKRAGEEYVSGGISETTAKELVEPIIPREVYESAADASWGVEKTDGYDIRGSAVSERISGSECLKFTKQMAAFYTPDGKERVVEMHYTDANRTYQILMATNGATVITEGFKKYTTKIETPYALWKAISQGEVKGQDALFQKQYKVLGDFDTLMQWDELFSGGKPKTKKAASSPISERKTDMKVFLIPWIVIWIAMAINPTVGSVLGVV